MEGEQISSIVTSNGPARLSDSEGSVHQYPVMYVDQGVMKVGNGRWVAYLCAKDEHFWLGSFETEEGALVAQQIARVQFCDVNSHTPQYRSHFTADEVCCMTVDKSYATLFPDFLGAHVQEKPDSAAVPDAFGLNLRRLFAKVLTPSDAGKLNRLVIPKRYAIQYFPLLSQDGGATKDAEVVFYDMSMKLWKFRYCYWGSSKSYVFTRGWSGFLKEKCLQPKDAVIFSAYDGWVEAGKQVYVIDVAYDNNAGGDPLIPDINDTSGGFPKEILLMLPAPGRRNEYIGGMEAQHGFDDPMIPDVTDNVEAFPMSAGGGSRRNEETGKMDAQQGIKLFGVNIIRGG